MMVSAIQSQIVSITGQVEKPGAYEMQEGDSVPELIARAGGAKPEAALMRISVTRKNGTVQVVDALEAMRDGKKMNVPLEAGTFVVVPLNQRTVTVLGAVNNQGTFVIPEDKALTLGDALSKAGGTRQLAKVSQIGLFKEDPNNAGKVSKPEVVAINQISNGQLVLNRALEEGTIVYVPEGKLTQSAWQKLTSGLSAFALLGRGLGF